MVHQADSLDFQLAEFVQAHPSLLVLTGAGISIESGLGAYRDRYGQWQRRQPITGQVFIHDELARKRYWARSYVGWPAFSRAIPAASHNALKQLQLSGHTDLLVTQNVDRLHQKAGHENVIDLHGVLATVSCVACDRSIERDDFQHQLLSSNYWLQSLSGSYAPDGDADLDLNDLKPMIVPPCTNCGDIMKPDVVFFGESVPRHKVSHIMNHLMVVDALLVAGSSLMVYSGYRFCKEAHRLGKPIAIINEGITRADELADLKVGGDCGERLKTLAGVV